MLRTCLFLAAMLLVSAVQADPRDRIKIVGASAPIAYIQSVAQSFARHWNQPTPSLEVTGTGGGFQLFCAGVGFEHPDVVAAARPMTRAERDSCAQRGVTDITEVEFGRDAVVLVHAGNEPRFDVSRAQLFAALAADVASGGGLKKNPNKQWDDVDSNLPSDVIRVMAPEPNTSAAIAFVEHALVDGCKEYPTISAMKDAERERVCRSLRRDGHVVNAEKLEYRVVEWLEKNKTAFAALSYTMYKRFSNDLAANLIEGVEPSNKTIGNRTYPLVSSTYIYLKDQHAKAVPRLQHFFYELTSERALGPEGYIAELGLVPLDDIGRNKARDAALRFGL
jgi:phosphate transport system substrate-binding protein